ncbi:MAG: hypothetical protein H0U72_02905 [Nitrosospira sp.]|nr:hypothetical protein [Nitrosospira sp.]
MVAFQFRKRVDSLNSATHLRLVSFGRKTFADGNVSLLLPISLIVPDMHPFQVGIITTAAL